MAYLPPINLDATTLRLPLAEPTALALETALLSEDEAAREMLLQPALASDPALVLWALFQEQAQGQPPSRSLAELARTLARRLLGWLAPLAVPSEAERASPAATMEQAAPLAGRTVAVAALAAALAEAGTTSAAEQFYLLAVMYMARDWFMLNPDAALAAEPSLPLQAPQAALIEILSRDKAGEGPVDCVRRAMMMLDGVAPLPAELPLDAAALHQRRQAVESYWRREAPHAVPRLAALVSRLERLEQLENDFARTLEREKVEAVRQLAYGAGHEINNPLANISARAQTLIKEELDPERRRRLAAINAQAFRAHEMIADLMLFSRPPQLVRQEIDLVPLVDRLVDELSADAQSQGTEIRRLPSVASLLAHVDPVQLAVALRAMCVNSLEALGSGGTIELRIGPPSDLTRPANWAELVVADDGPGISPEARRHLFDPFFSGREAGRGLGFGLCKCWRIVTEHGGQIEVESAAGHGAIFKILLPTNESGG